MDSADVSLSSGTSPAEMLLSQLPRELRNRIYSYLIPAVLEVQVHRFCLMPAQELEQTKCVADVEAVPSASWQQLANVKLVCRQIRDELSDEIKNAKKTKATGLLVDMKKARNYGRLQILPPILEPGGSNYHTWTLDSAVLAGFEEITFGMPLITLEDYAVPDHPYWKENGIAYYEDSEDLGGYDFWYGRFKYTKHKNDQGTSTWSLDAMEVDFLSYDEEIKVDLVKHEVKLAAAKKHFDTKVVEKQNDCDTIEGFLAELQAHFYWGNNIECKEERIRVLSSWEGIDTVNTVDEYKRKGYDPSYFAIFGGWCSGDEYEATDDADSAHTVTYYL